MAGDPDNEPLDGLGRGFARLWAATAFSSVVDGVLLTAAPLVAVALTSDPLVIGLISAMPFLPWLVVGPVSGAVVDRRDARTVMASMTAARAVVLATLTLRTATGWLTLPHLALGLFALGVAQTMVDSATQVATRDWSAPRGPTSSGPTGGWPPPRRWGVSSPALPQAVRCSQLSAGYP